MNFCRCVASTLLLAAVLPLAAQTPEGPLAALRAKTDLNDEDRTQIRIFVMERITAIITNQPGAAQTATDELRTAFTGTENYQRAYATLAVEAVGTAFGRAELVPATRLLAVLNTFNVVEAHTVFLEALRDERVGVRAAGAVGLRALRSRIAQAGGDTFQAVLAGLQQAGARERSRDTLRSIYGALNYAGIPGVANPRAAANAVLALLEARAAQYGQAEIPALGADDAGLRAARESLANFEDETRNRLIVVTGTLVRYAVDRYTGGEPKLADVRDGAAANRDQLEFRNAAERLVLIGEELLIELLKPNPAPQVSENMRRLNTANMKIEWQKWSTALQTAVGRDFALSPGTGG